MNEPLLKIEDLSMTYRTLRGEIRPVNELSLSVSRGEAVGLIGESGCGKTTVANCVMRLLPENARVQSGRIQFRDTDLLTLKEKEMRKVRWGKISLIFQAAMNALNPVMRVGDQIIEAVQTHGDARTKEARNRAEELFSLVGVDISMLDHYAHEYSGGMKQRAIIAMALACSPELVIADEPTTALDVIVQAQIIEEIVRLQKKLGMALLYISHDIAVVAGVCRYIGVMYAGNLVEYGDTAAIVREPVHPYTWGLMNSLPRISGEKRPVESIPGEVPDLHNLPPGCVFHPRCFRARDACAKEVPRYEEKRPGVWAACHYPLEEKE